MISPNSLRAAAAKNRRPKQPSLPLTGVRRSPRQLTVASPATAGVEGSGRCLYFTSTDIAGKTDCQRQSISLTDRKRNSLPMTGDRRSPRQLHIASSATACNVGADHFDDLVTEASRALCFSSPRDIELQSPAASTYPSKKMSGGKRKSDAFTVPKMSGGKRFVDSISRKGPVLVWCAFT